MIMHPHSPSAPSQVRASVHRRGLHACLSLWKRFSLTLLYFKQRICSLPRLLRKWVGSGTQGCNFLPILTMAGPQDPWSLYHPLSPCPQSPIPDLALHDFPNSLPLQTLCLYLLPAGLKNIWSSQRRNCGWGSQKEQLPLLIAGESSCFEAGIPLQGSWGTFPTLPVLLHLLLTSEGSMHSLSFPQRGFHLCSINPLRIRALNKPRTSKEPTQKSIPPIALCTSFPLKRRAGCCLVHLHKDNGWEQQW